MNRPKMTWSRLRQKSRRLGLESIQLADGTWVLKDRATQRVMGEADTDADVAVWLEGYSAHADRERAVVFGGDG